MRLRIRNPLDSNVCRIASRMFFMRFEIKSNVRRKRSMLVLYHVVININFSMIMNHINIRSHIAKLLFNDFSFWWKEPNESPVLKNTSSFVDVRLKNRPEAARMSLRTRNRQVLLLEEPCNYAKALTLKQDGIPKLMNIRELRFRDTLRTCHQIDEKIAISRIIDNYNETI